MQIFVIDVAGGDDIPRKGGPGIARADLLAINKTDLAPYVGSDVERMVREATERRGALPVAAISLRERRHAPSPTGSAAASPPSATTATCTRAWKASPITTTTTPTHVHLEQPSKGSDPLRVDAGRGGGGVHDAAARWSGSRRACSRRGGSTLLRSQAGPLAGDHDRVEIVVECGTLTIEPVAATVALPGAEQTVLELDVTVGDGARLVLEDAPLVVAEGADVVRTTTIRLGAGAVAIVRDLVVLGRAGEGPGRLESVLRVEGPDGVILHDALRVDPATWDDDAYVALAPGHRAVGIVAVLGEGADGAGGR